VHHKILQQRDLPGHKENKEKVRVTGGPRLEPISPRRSLLGGKDGGEGGEKMKILLICTFPFSRPPAGSLKTLLREPWFSREKGKVEGGRGKNLPHWGRCLL